MADDDQSWRFKGFQGSGGAYNQTLSVDTPFAREQFQAQYGNGPVNAVNRTTGSPSGTDWNATFGENRQRGFGGIGSPSGTDWSKTFGSNGTRQSRFLGGFLAGNDTTKPPSPSDLDETFFGGSAPTPTPTPTPKPSIAFYRSRLADSYITKRDHEMYGAGSDYGFNA